MMEWATRYTAVNLGHPHVAAEGPEGVAALAHNPGVGNVFMTSPDDSRRVQENSCIWGNQRVVDLHTERKSKISVRSGDSRTSS